MRAKRACGMNIGDALDSGEECAIVVDGAVVVRNAIDRQPESIGAVAGFGDGSVEDIEPSLADGFNELRRRGDAAAGSLVEPGGLPLGVDPDGSLLIAPRVWCLCVTTIWYGHAAPADAAAARNSRLCMRAGPREGVSLYETPSAECTGHFRAVAQVSGSRVWLRSPPRQNERRS